MIYEPEAHCVATEVVHRLVPTLVLAVGQENKNRRSTINANLDLDVQLLGN